MGLAPGTRLSGDQLSPYYLSPPGGQNYDTKEIGSRGLFGAQGLCWSAHDPTLLYIATELGIRRFMIPDPGAETLVSAGHGDSKAVGARATPLSEGSKAREIYTCLHNALSETYFPKELWTIIFEYYYSPSGWLSAVNLELDVNALFNQQLSKTQRRLLEQEVTERGNEVSADRLLVEMRITHRNRFTRSGSGRNQQQPTNTSSPPLVLPPLEFSGVFPESPTTTPARDMRDDRYVESEALAFDPVSVVCTSGEYLLISCREQHCIFAVDMHARIVSTSEPGSGISGSTSASGGGGKPVIRYRTQVLAGWVPPPSINATRERLTSRRSMLRSKHPRSKLDERGSRPAMTSGTSAPISPLLSTRFNCPHGLALDEHNRCLYVSDSKAHFIKRIPLPDYLFSR